MSASSDEEGPFQGIVAGESELREAIAVLRNEFRSLQRLEPVFVQGTADLHSEIQSLRRELAEVAAAGGGGVISAGDMPGLRAELRSTLRETTEHLRTLLVEEVNELRSELQGVKSRLTDRRSQDRADLQTSLAAGSDTLRAALAEDSASVRAELEAVRAQLKEQQVADQQLLRAELRAALREWNEHLRTRIVEEATELRTELHQVRGQLADQQTQHRSDLKAALSEGSAQLLAAVTETTAALRTDVAFLRDQLATREMVAGAVAQQEQLRGALMAEIEWLRADLQALPAQFDERRTSADTDTRAVVQEATRAAEVAFAQHADRLLGEIGALLAQHEAHRGDEGQQLRAIVTAGTENLRAELLAETAAARTSLVEQAERLRTEVQAVWTHLIDQHAEERGELARALAEGTDHVRASLRREVEAIGTGLTAGQAAAQDELASLRGRVEAFSALFSTAQSAARSDIGDLRDQMQALNTGLTTALQDSAGVRVQLDALGMDLTAAQAMAREEAAGLRGRLDEVVANDLGLIQAQLDALAAELPGGHAAASEQLREAVLEQSEQLRVSLAEQADQVRAAVEAEAASARIFLLERTEQLRAAVADETASSRESLRGAMADEVASTGESLRSAMADEVASTRESLRSAMAEEAASTRETLRAAMADEAASSRETLRAAMVDEAASTRETLRAATVDEAASARDALLERSDQLRTELQAVWSQLNDEHGLERLQLEETLQESAERLRASLLVELTEFIRGQVDTLGRTNAAALAEQVDLLRAAIEDPEGHAQRERLLLEATMAAEKLTTLQLELEGWRQQASEDRTGEVDALLAAVSGNEERLQQLVASMLANADRRQAEEREETRAAFAAAAEERQSQLAYLEAALQTFNQALALGRQETQALVTWSQQATDASVAELSGRLDALGSMLARMLAGEGTLEVGEAVAALRADLARISRKLAAKPKAPGPDVHTAKRASRPAPATRARRPTRPS